MREKRRAMTQRNWAGLHGESFHGVRTLVTGGAGFIGSHLVEALTALGASVVVLDNLAGGATENIAPFKPEFIQASVLDESAVGRAMAGCKYVFHLAALGSVPHSVERPREFHEVNVTGTLNVLEAARAAGVKRVMFAASSAAYGETPQLVKTESIPPAPRSPYAANKIACEAMMVAWSASYGLDTASLRYFNIFGPRQNANSAYAAVIAAFAKAIIAGKPPTIFGDGLQSRDFTFVDNAVHANLLAARSAKPIGGEVINIACGRSINLNQLATMMAGLLGRPDLRAAYAPERAGDVKHSLADLSRAKAMLGYEPIVDFEAGLKPTVEWYRSVL
jgi:nucleoside-diphosphate-sugar epimerase